MSGDTNVGMIVPRVPAGDARKRLVELAQKGSEYFPRWKFGVTALICDTCTAALMALTIAEHRLAELTRSLAASQVRIDKLRAENEALRRQVEWRDEPTKRTSHPELIARTATRTGILATPEER